jgi:integrase
MGCTITRDRHGMATFRFRGGKLPNGKYEWQVSSGVKYTDKNLPKLRARAQVMGDELDTTGTLDITRWFPKRGIVTGDELVTTTIGEYFAGWIERQAPPVCRRWTHASYKKHFAAHVLPALGALSFSELTTGVLSDFRAMLRRKLAPKTCRDIIDGSFRALCRDAREHGKLAGDPFSELGWRQFMSTHVAPEIDPYDEDEVALLLDWFKASCPWYYALVYTAFATGMRTGELLGLTHEHVDLRKAMLKVRASRSWGESNAPKTKESRRDVPLAPDVIAVLRAMPTKLDATPRTFWFTNQHGHAAKQEDFTAGPWRRAHVATKVRQRGGFYQTRHSFISRALTAGCNLTWLAKYTGTSVDMIQRSYGAFLGSHTDELAKLNAPRVPSGTRRSG